MVVIYRVPDGLESNVVGELAALGVRPGDRLVVESGQRPQAVRDITPGIMRFLPQCHLLGVRHCAPPEAPGQTRLHLVQGGA